MEAYIRLSDGNQRRFFNLINRKELRFRVININKLDLAPVKVNLRLSAVHLILFEPVNVSILTRANSCVIRVGTESEDWVDLFFFSKHLPLILASHESTT